MIRIPISGARPQRPPQRWGREPGGGISGPGAGFHGRDRGHVELALGYHLVAAVTSKAGDAPPALHQGPGGVPERGFKVEAVMAVPVVCRVMLFEAYIPAGDVQGAEVPGPR